MERIQYEKTKESDAIEVLFCKKFEALKKYPMSDEHTKAMIALMLMNVDGVDPRVYREGICLIIENRLKNLGYSIDVKSKLMLAYMIGSPGTAIMYCYFMAYHCKKKGLKTVEFDEFCENMFPFGFPSETDLQDLWDSQKVMRAGNLGPDNLLDYSEAAISIIAD